MILKMAVWKCWILNPWSLLKESCCVKRYVENFESPWKYVLDFYLKKVGGKFLFHCKFDYRTLSITLPTFYRECLQAWSSMNNYDSSSYEGIMNQIIWNNKYILSEGKSFFHSVFYNRGILKVGDQWFLGTVFFLKVTKFLNLFFPLSLLFPNGCSWCYTKGMAFYN